LQIAVPFFIVDNVHFVKLEMHFPQKTFLLVKYSEIENLLDEYFKK